MMKRQRKIKNKKAIIGLQLMHDLKMSSRKLSAKMPACYDLVLISTDHSCYDYEWIVKNAKLTVDTRNATAGVRKGRKKIVKA